MKDIRFKLSPPWSVASSEYIALFGGDPEIECCVDVASEDPAIVLQCSNGDKVTALQQILPCEIEFGNVTLAVDIDGIPSNRAFATKAELFDTAFGGNPVYAYAVCPSDQGYVWFDTTYVVFKNTVVQFFADNLNDCHGIISTLYQDIAKDILTGPAVDGVFFNTDVEHGGIGKPIGEWP